MNSYNCSICKNQVNENDKFCPHCGAPVIANSPETKSIIHCPKCNHTNPENVSFCEKCGTSLTATGSSKNQKSGPQTFTSAGTYSGKMIKGKTSKSWKVLLYIILSIVIIGTIAIVIWFQHDPDAGEKLKTIAGGILVVVIFIFFVIRGYKKGRRRRGSGHEYDQGINDNDNDFSGDSSDDGGNDD